MNRAKIAALAMIAAAWFPVALAQPAKGWRMEFLTVGPTPKSLDAPPYNSLIAGLKELGYSEGKNLVVGWHFVPYERLEAQAREIAAAKPDVIVTRGTPATLAAHRAAPATPVVTTIAVDLVGAGLAKSLARPGGQVTGLSNAGLDTAGKQLELLREILPSLKTVAVLLNPNNPGHRTLFGELSRLSSSIGISAFGVDVAPNKYDEAFASAVRRHAQAVIVPGDSLFRDDLPLATAGTRFRIPAIFIARAHVQAGGLISYGPDVSAMFRQTATYVDKILRGAKPGDLPIEEPSTFDLAINLKAAKAIGVTIPQRVLLRASMIVD